MIKTKTMTAVEWLYELSKQREPDKFDWEKAKQMESEQSKAITLQNKSESKAIPELSDEEIEEEYDLPSWVDGAKWARKWYREQLKQRQ